MLWESRCFCRTDFILRLFCAAGGEGSSEAECAPLWFPTGIQKIIQIEIHYLGETEANLVFFGGCGWWGYVSAIDNSTTIGTSIVQLDSLGMSPSWMSQWRWQAITIPADPRPRTGCARCIEAQPNQPTALA